MTINNIRIYCLLLLGVFLAFFNINLYADVSVNVSQSKSKYIVGPYISYIEDIEGRLSLETAHARYVSGHASLKESFDDVFNLGFNQSVFWLFFSVESDELLTDNYSSWLLEIAQPLIKSASLFVFHENALIYHNDKYYLSDTDNSRNVVFDIKNIKYGKTDFVLRIDSYFLAKYPLTLWEPSALSSNSSTSLYLLGLYFGIMGIVMIFNIVISFLTKDLSYLYYIGYIFSVLLFFTSYSGIGNKFIWGSFSEVNSYIGVVSIIVVMIFSLRFSSIFGNRKKLPNIFGHSINIFTLAGLITSLVLLITNIPIGLPVIILFIVYMLILAAIIFYSKYKNSIELIFISFSVIIIFISLVIFLLPLILFTPVTFISDSSLYFGTAIQIVSLSFVFANQINMERKKRYQALVREGQAFEELKIIEKGYFKKAMMDSLTGLPNRVAIEVFSDNFLNLKIYDRTPLAISLIKISNYHQINNTFGFKSSDLIMENIARKLDSNARSLSDCIPFHLSDEDAFFSARLDDVSFIVFFNMKENKQKYIDNTTHLIAKLNNSIIINDISVDINARAGMSFSPEHSTNVFTLIRFAQAALESNSSSEADVLVYSNIISQQATRKLRLINDLREAIANKEISLVYQPQLDISLQKIDSLEVLMRWKHHEYDQIDPSEFIILAEQAGLIDELSDWLIEQVLDDILWLLERGFKLKCAINISASSLSQYDFTKKLVALFKKLNLSPEMLTLELKEMSLMKNPMNSAKVIQELSKLGFNISIDNFGVENSTLAYLKQLPLSEVKIDKSLITDIDMNNNDRIISKSIIALVHAIGAKVCAEGVETASCLKILEQYQCDKAQGFHIAKPLTKEDLVVWIDQSQFMTH